MSETVDPNLPNDGRKLVEYLHGGTPDGPLYRMPLPEDIGEPMIDQAIASLEARVHPIGRAVVRDAHGSELVLETRKPLGKRKLRRLGSVGLGLLPIQPAH